MPIYGPFSRSYLYPNALRVVQQWYRQTAPYQGRLQYSSDKWFPLGGNNRPDWSSVVNPPVFDPIVSNRAIAKARDRLNNSVGANSQLGASLGEGKQSMKMIVDRAGQLLRIAKDLKNFNIPAAYKHFSVSARGGIRPKGWRRIKDFGDLWLEFHFGWVPLVKDIGEAVEVLQAQPKPITIKGRGQSRETYTDRPDWPYYSNIRTQKVIVRSQVIAEASVSSPNLFLANRLGFINPAAIAWELVPFSFVVDWFIPVGNFLNQYTDLVGLSLTNPATTLYGIGEYHYDINDDHQHSCLVQTRRTRSIANFSLQPRQLTGVSATRAATAISLLLQQLKPHA